MEKKQCKRERAKKKKAIKVGLSKSLIITLFFFISGVFLLAWCGYKMANPFPYASLVGIGFIIITTLITLVTSNRKWSKNRDHYPDDLGGRWWW